MKEIQETSKEIELICIKKLNLTEKEVRFLKLIWEVQKKININVYLDEKVKVDELEVLELTIDNLKYFNIFENHIEALLSINDIIEKIADIEIKNYDVYLAYKACHSDLKNMQVSSTRSLIEMFDYFWGIPYRLSEYEGYLSTWVYRFKFNNCFTEILDRGRKEFDTFIKELNSNGIYKKKIYLNTFSKFL